VRRLDPKTPSESSVIMTQLVLPQHTNPLGSIFGGVIMSWMDIAAGICAQRHSRTEVVTAAVDTLHFLSPVKIGWVVTLKATVNYARTSSCEVGVRIDSENPLTGEHFHTASAYFTMVALGSDKRPTKIPPLRPESELEKQRFQEAEFRWQERQRLRKEAKD
jgi:acyl-CoA hydrolase